MHVEFYTDNVTENNRHLCIYAIIHFSIVCAYPALIFHLSSHWIIKETRFWIRRKQGRQRGALGTISWLGVLTSKQKERKKKHTRKNKQTNKQQQQQKQQQKTPSGSRHLQAGTMVLPCRQIWKLLLGGGGGGVIEIHSVAAHPLIFFWTPAHPGFEIKGDIRNRFNLISGEKANIFKQNSENVIIILFLSCPVCFVLCRIVPSWMSPCLPEGFTASCLFFLLPPFFSQHTRFFEGSTDHILLTIINRIRHLSRATLTSYRPILAVSTQQYWPVNIFL